MKDLILIFVIALILGLVIVYLWRAKKKGVKCVGCPDSGSCSGKCAGCSGCSCSERHQK